jgi:CP2 transcription factor
MRPVRVNYLRWLNSGATSVPYISVTSDACMQVNIAVNCLSTDFSYQKGIKVSIFLVVYSIHIHHRLKVSSASVLCFYCLNLHQ